MQELEQTAIKHDDLLYAVYFSNETIIQQKATQFNFMSRLSRTEKTEILNWQLNYLSGLH